MRLKESVEDGIDVFTLEGEIDLHYAPVLRTLLQAKVKARCPALVLDLASVTFIDSAGLAAIIEYLRDSAAYGGVIVLCGLSDTLKSILEIVRLHKVLPIFPSLPEAIAAIKGGKVKPPEAALFDPSAK